MVPWSPPHPTRVPLRFPPSPLGRACVGVSVLGFAAVQFMFGDFIPGRAPAWPEGVPGQALFAWVTGAYLIVAGVAMMSGKGARWAGIGTSALVFTWALVRHLPGLVAHPGGIALTNTGKALAITGGLLAAAGAGAWGRSGNSPSTQEALRRAGRLGLGAFMVIGSIQHARFTQFVAALIPAWMPARVPFVYVAGLALFAGGVGMQVPRTRRLAAVLSAAMLGSWVFIVHLPRALSTGTPADVRNEWTALFEALLFTGTALIVAGHRPVRPTGR